jgi:hypothetical protein
MKKRLLIAAIAATMSVAATADISITGGAFVSFASQEVGKTGHANANKDDQHVHIKVVGSAGDTKVVATIDSGSATHVDPISKNHTPYGATASNDDVSNVDTDSLHMDSLYITTKVGPVNIKAGDYWGTIGLGAHSKEADKKNALSISTEVGGWKLGLFTANGSGSHDTTSSGTLTNVSASGKVGPVTLGLVHNPDDFTDLTVQGTVGGVSIAAEKWDDTSDVDNDTTLIHIGGKVSNFKWDVAQLKNDVASVHELSWNSTLQHATRDAHSTGKFAPLGSMLIGTEARDRTATAVADVNDFTEILGVAVSTQLAGNTVKVIYTKNTLGADDKVKAIELIVSRPLGGATLTANIGKLSGVDEATKTAWGGIEGNATNMGLRLDVKF